MIIPIYVLREYFWSKNSGHKKVIHTYYKTNIGHIGDREK